MKNRIKAVCASIVALLLVCTAALCPLHAEEANTPTASEAVTTLVSEYGGTSDPKPTFTTDSVAPYARAVVTVLLLVTVAVVYFVSYRIKK